jgi:3-methyladenine DNA glycosylase AlkD
MTEAEGGECGAGEFLERLEALRPAEARGRYRHGDCSGEPDEFMDVPMRQVFQLARDCMAMRPVEIERLLESAVHEVRVGAVSVMDWQARAKRAPEARRAELFQLYLRRHDRINHWDLVDRAAPYVVGGYLSDKPRDVLYRLARSQSPWERRTAIVSTYYFIRQGDVEDTFAIAAILAHDPHVLVQKAVGGWVREAGKRDPQRLLALLDEHAATMPRTLLRYAVEKLDAAQREHYMGLKARAGLPRDARGPSPRDESALPEEAEP